MRFFMCMAMIAGMCAPTVAVAGDCPVKGKPYTIHFDTGGKIHVRRIADGILHDDSIDKAGQKTEMAVAHGLYVMASVSPQGTTTYQYETDPRQLKLLPGPHEKISASARVATASGGEARHTTTVAMVEKTTRTIDGCARNAVTLNVVQNANGTAVSTERHFIPDLLISVRTVVPRAVGSVTSNAVRFELQP